MLIEMIRKIYNLHKELISNYIWRSLQLLGKQGITFLVFIICAKLLSPYDFGIYNYILAIVFLLVMFGDFGISTATSKFVAEYNVKDEEKLKKVLFNSAMIILGLSLIIIVLTFSVGKFYLKEKYIYVVYLLPLIFLIPMTSLYDGIYRGLKRFKILAFASIIPGILSLSIVDILIKKYGLVGALIFQNLFYFLLFLALALGYREFRLKFDKNIMKEIGTYSTIIGLGSIGFILYGKVDLLFLGHYGYITEIGYLAIINKFFSMIVLPLYILGQIIAPDITRYSAQNKFKIILNKYKKYLFISFVLAILITSMSYYFLPVIFQIFLPEYNNLITLNMLNFMLLVLLISIFNSIIPQGFITPTGHYRIITYLLIISGFLKFILNVIFINYFGFMGVIYSSIIVVFVSNIIMICWYYKLLLNKQEVN